MTGQSLYPSWCPHTLEEGLPSTSLIASLVSMEWGISGDSHCVSRGKAHWTANTFSMLVKHLNSGFPHKTYTSTNSFYFIFHLLMRHLGKKKGLMFKAGIK